ncbi:MAG TPA: hypothetical protein PK450_01700 [Paracoccaceae bacterium]|nr:hypothetical protein [Paracoccaceae bacterium]
MLKAALGAILLSLPLSAEAAVIEATFTGHLYTGADGLGLLGAPSQLQAGLPVVTTFRYDTTLGITPASPIFGAGLEGGQTLGVPSPVIFSSITVGQTTLLGQNSEYSIVGMIDDPALGHGMVVGGTSTYQRVPQAGTYATIAAQFYGQGISVPSSIDVPFSMAGLMALNVQGGTSRATGSFQFENCVAAYQCGYTIGGFFIDDFRSQILPAAVPLPASGGLLLAALGAGGALRRKKAAPQG